ncbi:MAG: DUF4178 domain-containing protein [Lachnospiraceae bacterium]|nr:DUF4178 domain-containing protein [Lachnospiraceae bacterium]
MEYSVGDTLLVGGRVYHIIGKIHYKNLSDNCCWFEYRMESKETPQYEKWLSYDSVYKEYSISEVVSNVSTAGYHEVDSGEEEVIGVWGSVDVAVGDRARFREYEDSTEEKIISTEFWDDYGEETSVGYYLDLDEIRIYDGNESYASSFKQGDIDKNQIRKTVINVAVWAVLIMYVLWKEGLDSDILFQSHSIAKYLKKSAKYTYVTSITGNLKQDADVYKTTVNLDTAVKDIINGIEGDTQDVQQNTEDGDNSVAILTDKEYCLVYVSEENETMIQISSRKYAYTNDNSLYHAGHHTHRYYRRYYYSRGYHSDAGSYGKYTSPYASFDDATVNSNYNDAYSSYSSSVRQASVGSRTSSGGGLSSGK